MKRTKRVLSLIICLLLTITSLPVTQLVFADVTTENIVSLHETTFEKVSDLNWVLNANASPHVTPTIDEGGYYTFEHTKSSGTDTNIIGRITRTLGDVVIAKDTDNRTKVTANNIDGKYIIEFDVDVLMKKHELAGDPYYDLELMSGNSELLIIRLRGSYFQVFNKGQSYMRSSHKSNTVDLGYNASKEAENLRFKITYDTVNKTISTYVNDNLMTDNNGKLASSDEIVPCPDAAAIDGLRITTLSRADVGTYLKFREFKITQVERAANATLSALPEKLAVADVNNVTETSVTLSAVSGVTWESADTDAATVNGNTLTLIPSTEGTKEAEVTATFKENGATYVKTYIMTLAKAEVSEPTPDPEPEPDPEPTPDPEPEPDPEPTPDPKPEPDPEPTPDPESAPGTLVDSYVFSDSDVLEHRVYNGYSDTTNFSGKYTADGFVLNRESATVSGTGTKPSNEFMRINLTKKVGDKYQYGLKGNYAIDLTVNGKLRPGMGKSEIFLDGYIVSSGDMDSLLTENDTDLKIQFITELNFTGNTFFQVSSASDSSKKTERAPIPVNEDTVIRLIVDTDTGNVKLYTSEDNKESFEYYGEVTGDFKNDEIKGFMFNPWLGLVKGSTMAFKKIDIYELSIAKVAFYVDGLEYETVSVNTGSTVSSLTAPEKENYVFEGWYLEGTDTEFDFTKPIEEDIKLYAKYKGAPSNIVFKADGETIETFTVEFGSTIGDEIPEIPAKEGYTAVGWFIGDTPFNASAPINAKEMEVNAKYAEGELDTYTVTFNVDGEFYAEENALEGYPILNVPEAPTKVNYIFTGWALDNEVFDINSPITSDITLDAMFEPKDINVNYYIDKDMKELYSTGTGKYNTPIGTLPIPVRNTYKFLGWKNADGTDLTEEQILTEDISVYAEWESMIEVIFVEDITTYGKLTADRNVEFTHTGTGATTMSYDNGVKLSWVKAMPTSRTFDNNLVVKFKVPVGEEDTVNRTQVYNNKLVGDYEVEVKMDVKLSGNLWDPVVANAPYGYYSTGFVANSTFSNILSNRLYSTYLETFNSVAGATSDFNSTNTIGKTTKYNHSDTSEAKLDDGTFKNVTNRLRFNSATNYAEMTAPNSEDKAHGKGMGLVTGINGFRFNMMACFAPGDYIRVKNIKVTQYNLDTTDEDYLEAMSILEKLPDTIVAEGDSPYNVTKNLVIPAIRGVTWSSSDKSAADVTTGVITKWYESQNVKITALVNAGDYIYSKEYMLTIGGDESIVKETVLDETFATEADMKNWTFETISDSKVADYVINDNGIKISKVVAPEVSDSTLEEKTYFAYYDLYKETKSDAYTSTATKDLKGVYDISINLGEYIATSKVPMNIIFGYRALEKIYECCSLDFDSSGVKFKYVYDPETIKESELGAIEADSIIKIRIDNIMGEIALYVDGELRERVKYYSFLGEDAMINSVITCIDENNEIGDFVTIKGIKVEKIVANDIPALADVIAVADGLTVNTVTINPDAVSAINVLPETIGNYKVDWKSSSNQIDVETQEVFFDSTANPVTVTAEIYDANATYPVVVRKNFSLTVRAAENENELGQFEIAKLGRITEQNYSDIRYNLNLPVAEGVVWESSRTDIITNDGKIVDTVVLTEATPVTFTATSKGVSKTYNLVVAKRTEQVPLSSGNIPLSIKLTNKDNAKISADVSTKFTYTHNSTVNGKVNIVNENGDVLASMVTTPSGIYFDYKHSDYKEIAVEDGTSISVEILVMPDIEKVAAFVDGKLLVDYADLKINADYVAGVTTDNPDLSTGNVEMSVDKYGMLTANTDNFDYFEDVKFGYANAEGISLPKDVVSYGIITWESSNEALIDNNGSVTVPAVMTYANLEFKIAYDSESNSNIFIKKNFNIAVDCDDKNNIVSGIVPEFTNLVDPTNPESNVSDNKIKTVVNLADANKMDSEIIFNLGGEKTFNSIFIAQHEKGIEDYVIYKSNDGSTWTEILEGTFGDDPTVFAKFDTTVATYIKITAKQCTSKYIKINEIKVFLSATESELALIDLNALNIPATAEGTTIALPVKGLNGTVITWASSNESVISIDGKITRPSNATTVKLTATVIVDGEPVTREFSVYVDTKAASSGPSQVGGGAGGGGGGAGGGMASDGATSAPIIGETEDTVYSEDLKPTESTTNVYNDVKETDWYYSAVKTLTSKGIVSGDGTGYFYPTNNVTREQFVKMILEAIEVEVTAGAHSFSDVESGAWYEAYIATAVSNGIVNGVGGSNFGVGTNISRQDMAVLIERVLSYKEIEIEKAEVEPFADADSVSDYAKEAVANMKAIGLIQGYSNNYNPKDNLTRAEAATVIASLLELLAK